MTRREALITLGAVAAGAAVAAASQTSSSNRIDPNFVRMYDLAQRHRPATLSSTARIAPVSEPGTPLRVRAQLFGADGITPAAGVVLFAYQTDQTGVYHFADATGWKLQGWARTDASGSATFDTIRPAPYPDRNDAAHIHIYAEGPGVPRQTLETLLFDDDPRITAAQRAASSALGRFGYIRLVETRQGREECELLLRASGDHPF